MEPTHTTKSPEGQRELDPSLVKGAQISVTITSMAHGGEGIGHSADGRVVFVDRAFPGDTVQAELTQVKKSFLRGRFRDVVEAGPLRRPSSCPAAAAGAGCCDFAELAPEAEAQLKADIVRDQLTRLARLSDLPEVEVHELAPQRGWRTRVRFGVDAEGRAGLRKKNSRDIVTVACTQVDPRLNEGIVGEGARRFTPGSELVVVIDSTGQRHVVETTAAARGRRVEKVSRVLEGTGTVVQEADGHEFRFPATAFWQAHVAAPDAYAAQVRSWLGAPGQDEALQEDAASASEAQPRTHKDKTVAWDLYGGVGLFVPALADAARGAGSRSGSDATPGSSAVSIHSVDLSPTATSQPQRSLADFDLHVVQAKVEDAVATLPAPDVVVLDPPRTGAGAAVVAAVAGHRPAQVVHVGCDPATFARDLAAWAEAGYKASSLALFNAFPGTHHFEMMALLEPAV